MSTFSFLQALCTTRQLIILTFSHEPLAACTSPLSSAIKSLPDLKPHLQRAIFASQMEKTSISVTTNKPPSLPSTTWTSLRNHNPLQLTSIGRVMRHKESIHLVQGPPGTGKSSTIVGLVTALVSLLCCSNGLFISISKVISYYLTNLHILPLTVLYLAFWEGGGNKGFT